MGTYEWWKRVAENVLAEYCDLGPSPTAKALLKSLGLYCRGCCCACGTRIPYGGSQ